MEKNSYFKNTKAILNQNVHKFLYVLIKYIFLGENNIKIESLEKLNKFVRKISKKYNISLKKDNCYQIYNLKIILKFTKSQNYLFAGEIIENIIIRVLSFAFKIKSSEFFGKYLYNNLKYIRTEKLNFDNWIDSNLIQIFNNADLIKIIYYDEEESNNELFIENNPFIQLLKKISNLINPIKVIKKNKVNKLFSETTIKETLSNTKSTDETSIYFMSSCFYYDKKINMQTYDHHLAFPLSIFISTYIYYQNLHSPLRNFSIDSENLINLKFQYILSEAGINDCYLGTVLKPIRLDPKIEEIEMNKNRFGLEGILELHKSSIFNKGIKNISVKSCGIKSIYLKSLIENFQLYENNSIEEIDASSNYLKSDADKYLAKVISSLNKLKYLNLSYNNLQGGIAPFFITLKKLYREKKTKLETLILVKCILNNNDFYELGELLKSKYCQLKCLCISQNIIPSEINFFNSLKKNRSLKEIYLYDCGINSEKSDEIDRIISNSNLEIIHLNANPIYDFNQFIRIIYRNCLIKNKEEKENQNITYDIPCLNNLNMNKTDCFNRNIKKIKLIKEGIESLNLQFFDLTNVLYGYNLKNKGVKEYGSEIEKIQKDLEKKQKEYIQALKMIFESEIDKKKFQGIEFKNLDRQIKEIINNENSKKLIFIREEAKKLKSDLVINEDKDEDNKLKQIINYILFKRAEMIIAKNEKIIRLKKLVLI